MVQWMQCTQCIDVYSASYPNPFVRSTIAILWMPMELFRNAVFRTASEAQTNVATDWFDTAFNWFQVPYYSTWCCLVIWQPPCWKDNWMTVCCWEQGAQDTIWCKSACAFKKMSQSLSVVQQVLCSMSISLISVIFGPFTSGWVALLSCPLVWNRFLLASDFY